MKLIAADLDRTVIPNGPAEDDNSIEQLHAVLAEYDLRLIYVTARRIASVEKAIEQYGLPMPEAVIGQVGTTMHYRRGESFVPEIQWEERILAKAKQWNRGLLQQELDLMLDLEIQHEKEQNQFKLSYVLTDFREMERVVPLVKEKVVQIAGDDAEVIASADLNSGVSYVDILPTGVNKRSALDFFCDENCLAIEDILFAGDSENDLSVLLSHYPSVVVNNANNYVKKRVAEEKKGVAAYVASGQLGSNGNYGAGIAEAVRFLRS